MPELLIAQSRSLVPEDCIALQRLDTESDAFHLALAQEEADDARRAHWFHHEAGEADEANRHEQRYFCAVDERQRIEHRMGLHEHTFEDIQE